MGIDIDRVKKALPVEEGKGGRSVIRMRADVGQIVVDCVLRRRSYKEQAIRLGVHLETLNRFRKAFITDEVAKIVMVEANKMDAAALDTEVNDAQDQVEGGIMGVLAEQKKLYTTLNKRITDGDRDIEDMLPGLSQLLRDQTKSYEALLKVYSNLKNKTSIVLSLNEHPDVAKLMDALWVLFQEQPAAFARFQEIVVDKRIPLNVD